jgi:hypothetical protein
MVFEERQLTRMAGTCMRCFAVVECRPSTQGCTKMKRRTPTIASANTTVTSRLIQANSGTDPRHIQPTISTHDSNISHNFPSTPSAT